MTVRVRFAPSPTGYLHVGGARTALFNWLFAKANNGTFILRIEDTDRTRYSEEALTNLIAELKWLGLEWDEGPGKEGSFGPYQQSQRLDLYNQAAQKLVMEENAYPCFCTSDRLAILREKQESTKSPTGYDRACRNISKVEANQRIENGEEHVIRFKTPLSGEITIKDYLRGDISTPLNIQDDLVILKTDKFPTYHLASVVDDNHMQISHVLRGDEWIPSTPKHELLYQALGYTSPVFVHLPVILSETGGKLSKRKGAASVFDHRDLGFLPEALFNFLTLLGWNPGDDREIMGISELISAFNLDKISLKSSVFDLKKLEWMNAQYISKTDASDLLPFLNQELKSRNIETTFDNNQKLGIIESVKERAKLLPELFEQSKYFFTAPTEFDAKGKKRAWKEGADDRLEVVINTFSKTQDWTADNLEAVFHDLVEKQGGGFGAWGPAIRLSLCGILGGPDLQVILATLGQKETLSRLKTAQTIIRG